jgi:hypothetical protein
MGRSPSGRAIRCNLFAFQDKKISTAIPNAKHQKMEFPDFQAKVLKLEIIFKKVSAPPFPPIYLVLFCRQNAQVQIRRLNF